MKKINFLLLIAILLTACSSQPTIALTTPTLAPSLTITPSSTPTASPSPTPSLVSMNEFMKGYSYQSSYHGYSMPTSDWILENEVKPLGVDWIKINHFCFQQTDATTDIDCSAEEVSSDADLIHLIQQAHSHGIRVMLELAMLVRDGSNGGWAGTIGRTFSNDDWQAWFASYSKMALHYADLAEKNQFDYFTIGSEYQIISMREQEWRTLIGEVRKVYHGPILYSAAIPQEWEAIKWWDAVDAIGIHPYDYNLSSTNQPTVQQVTAAWKPITDRLENLSEKWDRPIIITEIGYESMDGISHGIMWGPNTSWKLDVQESAVMYQALINAFSGKPWFRGLFWFQVQSMGTASEPTSFYFNPYKPDVDIVRSFYGAPLVPTATPSPLLPSNFSHIFTIYENSLIGDWDRYAPNGDVNNIDLSQSKVAMNGNAIRATLPRGAELVFGDRVGIDLEPYQWLEFYIYVPKDAPNPPMLRVVLTNRDTYPMPHIVDLTNSQYIEDGHLEKGKWQRVDIPLEAMGPILEPISYILIRTNPEPNNIQRPMTIYVDNVRLLGN
jgi:hypothetical protein